MSAFPWSEPQPILKGKKQRLESGEVKNCPFAVETKVDTSSVGVDQHMGRRVFTPSQGNPFATDDSISTAQQSTLMTPGGRRVFAPKSTNGYTFATDETPTLVDKPTQQPSVPVTPSGRRVFAPKNTNVNEPYARHDGMNVCAPTPGTPSGGRRKFVDDARACPFSVEAVSPSGYKTTSGMVESTPVKALDLGEEENIPTRFQHRGQQKSCPFAVESVQKSVTSSSASIGTV